MKKTCNGCRAQVRINGFLQCEFGYKTKTRKDWNGIQISIKPLEECPKPKTWDEYYCQVRLLSGGKQSK